MSNCCSEKSSELEVLRHRHASILKVALGINAAMFIVEFWAGLVSGSVSLLADSLDMLGDALIYGFSLYAVTHSPRTKSIAALVKGLIMTAFGLFAVGQVVYTLLNPHNPSYETIGIIGLAALVANSICFALLWRHRADDINMSSVWLCSRNDVIANMSVIAAAVGVWYTNSGWPDLVVGVAIAALFFKSAITVLTASVRELRWVRA